MRSELENSTKPTSSLIEWLGGRRRMAHTLIHGLPNLLRETRLAQRENNFHQARPPKSGVVVDVGAGQGSHGRADMTIDKYVVDEFERSGAIDLKKPLIVADGHQLPIKDRAITYIVACHVLEHANHPDVFAAELSRVATAGFVQVPSREAELTFGWPFHHWLIDRIDDTLVFEGRGGARALTGELMHAGFAESTAFKLWFEAHRSRWHHSVEWQGKLNVKVKGVGAPIATATFSLADTVKALEKAHRNDMLRPLSPRLWSLLCCPVCHAEIVKKSNGIVCTGCDRTYPVAGGVPILLAEVSA
jgi:uncharacterized protein YbaR (Trm112 family)